MLVVSLCIPCPLFTQEKEVPEEKAEATVTEFIQAVKQKDAKAVYRLLDKSVHQKDSYAEFETFFDQNYSLIREEALKMEEALSSGELKEITILTCGRYKVGAVKEEGQWKILDDPFIHQRADDVNEISRGLEVAIQLQDLDAFYSYLSPDMKEWLKGELTLIQEAIHIFVSKKEGPFESPIHIPFGHSGFITLEKKGDYWQITALKLNDFHQKVTK